LLNTKSDFGELLDKKDVAECKKVIFEVFLNVKMISDCCCLKG
jgi:hypothetical protein